MCINCLRCFGLGFYGVGGRDESARMVDGGSDGAGNGYGGVFGQDENRSNDGIGMALIVNDSNPFRDVNKMLVQPPTLGNIYRR